MEESLKAFIAKVQWDLRLPYDQFIQALYHRDSDLHRCFLETRNETQRKWLYATMQNPWGLVIAEASVKEPTVENFADILRHLFAPKEAEEFIKELYSEVGRLLPLFLGGTTTPRFVVYEKELELVITDSVSLFIKETEMGLVTLKPLPKQSYNPLVFNLNPNYEVYPTKTDMYLPLIDSDEGVLYTYVFGLKFPNTYQPKLYSEES